MKHGNRLLEVSPLSGHLLELAYDDGARLTVDLSDLIESGGVYAALRDDAVFSQVRLGESGSFIEFPGPVDFCVDSLRHMAELQVPQPAK